MTTTTRQKKSGRPRAEVRRANSENVHRLHSIGKTVAEIAEVVGLTTQGVEYHTTGRCKCAGPSPGISGALPPPLPPSTETVGAVPVIKSLGALAPVAAALSRLASYEISEEQVDDYFRPVAELYQRKIFPAENPLSIDDIRNALSEGRLPNGWTAEGFTRLTVDMAQAEKKLLESNKLKASDTGIPRADVQHMVNEIIAHQQSILSRKAFDDWRLWFRDLLSGIESMR